MHLSTEPSPLHACVPHVHVCMLVQCQEYWTAYTLHLSNVLVGWYCSLQSQLVHDLGVGGRHPARLSELIYEDFEVSLIKIWQWSVPISEMHLIKNNYILVCMHVCVANRYRLIDHMIVHVACWCIPTSLKWCSLREAIIISTNSKKKRLEPWPNNRSCRYRGQGSHDIVFINTKCT